jgi:hypothetical protein
MSILSKKERETHEIMGVPLDAETPDQYAFSRASKPPFWLSGNPASCNNFDFYALGLAQKNRHSDNRGLLP